MVGGFDARPFHKPSEVRFATAADHSDVNKPCTTQCRLSKTCRGMADNRSVVFFNEAMALRSPASTPRAIARATSVTIVNARLLRTIQCEARLHRVEAGLGKTRADQPIPGLAGAAKLLL
jgi:hypothetical protein